MATCNGCGAAIEFVPTVAGRKIPVEVLPLNVVVTKGGPLRVVLADGSVVAARHAAEFNEPDPVVTGKVSHFALCPRAERFRAKPRRAP